eukprot:jgi/Botrbrau1/21750/Bobra.43_1s0144.1
MLRLILLQQSLPVTWKIIGCVVAIYICKGLKYLLNHERPDGAPEPIQGCPPPTALPCPSLRRPFAWQPWRASKTLFCKALLAAGTGLLTAFLVWLRVELGYHTLEQVGAGAVLGCLCAIVWHRTSWILPAREAGEGVPYSVLTVMGILMAYFIIKRVDRALTGKA